LDISADTQLGWIVVSSSVQMNSFQQQVILVVRRWNQFGQSA